MGLDGELMREHNEVRVGSRDMSDEKLQSLGASFGEVRNARHTWNAFKEAL